jgi:hypothetical protein
MESTPMIDYWIVNGVQRETRESIERRARELRRETLRATLVAIAKWARALAAAPAKRRRSAGKGASATG